MFLLLEMLALPIWQHCPFVVLPFGFLVWLLSTPMVLNVQNAPQPGSPSPKQYQPPVDPKVESFPYSPIQSSSYSYDEILQVCN